MLAVVAGPLGAAPAFADGGQSADEGYVIVLQALSSLVNEPTQMGATEAIAIVDKALAADDQDGVDVAILEQGKVALQSGNIEEGRNLLQESIAEAVASLEPAKGEETGTTEMLPPLTATAGISPWDWAFLALSALAVAVGVFFAVLFRPTQSLRELGRDIAAAKQAHRGAIRSTSKEA